MARPGILTLPDQNFNYNSPKSLELDFGARFGNLETLTEQSPRGLFSHVTDIAGNTDVPFLERRKINKKVVEWFECWRPWQQRILLCGLTNRCSTNQLETLATTLEPIFHRDFVMTIKHRYPSAPLKTLRNAGNGRKKFKKRKTKARVTIKLENSTLHGTETKSQANPGTNDQEQHRSNFNNEPLEPISDEATSPVVEQLADKVAESVIEQSLLEIGNSLQNNSPNNDEKEDRGTSDINEVKLISDTDHYDDNIAPPPPSSSNPELSLEPPPSSSVLYTTESSETLLMPRKQPANKYSSKYRMRPDKNFTLKKEPSNLTKSLPEEGMDMLKFGQTEWKELKTSFPTQHHNSWNRHEKMPSNPPSALSLRPSEDVHRHKSVGSLNVNATDFFKGDRFFNFGPYQAEIRRGVVRKPDLIEDIYIPIQKMYKSNKWFPETSREGTMYVKPNSAKLKLHFKQQLRQIWEWISCWEDFERQQLLKDVLKLCNYSLINYLGQCIYQRLEDRKEINWLPDRLLLLVFSHLSAEDIDNASLVCRRWHYLASLDELWMVKCHEYGIQHGMKKVAEKIYNNSAKNGEQVDWRLAYYELQEITEKALRDAPIPSPLPVASVTPDGMVRTFSGKYIQACSANESLSLISTSSSFYELIEEVDTLTPGLASKLVYESDKLKKAYRDFRVEEEERERQERLKQQEEEDDQMPDVLQLTKRADSRAVKTPNEDRVATNASHHTSKRRGTRSQSRMSTGMSGETLMDEINKTKAELEALKEEAQTPAKTVAQWCSRMVDNENAEDLSLDVRPAQMKKAIAVVPDPKQGTFIYYKARSYESKRKKKKDKAEKEEFISSVKCSRKLDGHTNIVSVIASDRRRLISGSLDRVIRIWDIRSCQPLHKLLGHKGAVTCFAFDNTVLYSGSWDCSIMVWNLVDFERIRVLHGHKDTVSSLAQDQKLVISGSYDGTVRIWNKRTLECEKIIRLHELHIMAMEYEGNFVYTAGSDGLIKMTDITTAEIIKVFSEHNGPIHKIFLQGDVLISTNSRGEVWFWDKETAEVDNAIVAHNDRVNSVKFWNSRFFTASSDMTIKEWDLKSMTCLRFFVGHKGAVTNLLFQDNKMVSSDSTGVMRIWDFNVQLENVVGQISHTIINEKDLLQGSVKM